MVKQAAIKAAEAGQGVGYLAVPESAIDPALMVLLRGLPLARRTRVVDVGANPNVEDAPYLDLLKKGLCDVLGFEPHPGAFADLQKIKGPRETYLPFAVGDGSDKELKVYRSHGFTSVFEPSLEARKLIAPKRWFIIDERVPMTTVALDSSADVQRFDLLKIDIQGGEADVFRGAERLLQTACAVIVELRYFRLYDGEPMMAELDRQLRGMGFSLHKIRPGNARPFLNSQIDRLNKKRMTDQSIDGDAVYLRDLAFVEKMDDEQVIHMALLGATVIGSHSLVLFCLDVLVARGLAAPVMPASYLDALPRHMRRGKAEAEAT
jgi:FkbM family methyltransferase